MSLLSLCRDVVDVEVDTGAPDYAGNTPSNWVAVELDVPVRRLDTNAAIAEGLFDGQPERVSSVFVMPFPDMEITAARHRLVWNDVPQRILGVKDPHRLGKMYLISCEEFR